MKTLLVSLATAGLLAAGSTQAMVVNVSADAAAPTVVTLDAGTYAWNWIGTAQGGAYDGWSTNGSDWQGALMLSVSYFGMTQTVVFDTFKPAGGFAADGRYQYSRYASAADALAAFQTSLYTVISLAEGAEAGPLSTGDLRIEIPPFPMTLSFSIPAEFTSTMGGVSLNVTAVPEPGTYTLMLAGLAVIAGLVLRRMRRDE